MASRADLSEPLFTVRVDVRERGLVAALKDLGVEARVESLPVADAIVMGRAGEFFVERKKVPDLAASIKDGRLRGQRPRLLEAAAGDPRRVVLIVEGTERLQAGSGGMTGDALWGAVMNTNLRDNITVLRTADTAETAYALVKLGKGAWVGTAAAAADVACGGAQRTPRAVRKARPGGLAACMLEAVPGMGAKRAEAIATYLAADGRGGVLGFCAGADAEAAVARIVVGGRKVGPALAARVFAALKGKPSDE